MQEETKMGEGINNNTLCPGAAKAEEQLVTKCLA